MKPESKKYLLWLAVSFLVAGIVEGYLPDDGSLGGRLALPHTLIVSVLIFVWCKSHASENGISTPRGYPAFAAIFPPLGLPLYFFKFFGFRSGGIKTLKSLGVFMLLGVSYLVPYVLLQNRNI